MISTKSIYQYLLDNRYRDFYHRPNGIDILVQFNKERRKAIVLVDSLVAGIYNKKQIRQFKREIHDVIKQTAAESILYLFVGTRISAINEYNTVSICQETGQRSTGVMLSFAFRQELHYLKDLCKLQDLEYKKLRCQDNSRDVNILYILIILNVYLFIRTYTGLKPIGIDANTLQHHQYGQLFAYMFFHANIRHLVGNMIMLLYLGRQILTRKGNILFLITYFCGGIGAGVYSILYKQFTINRSYTIGASGAIFAILGAMVALAFFDRETNLSKWAIVKYTLIVLIGSTNILTDNVCHIGGLVCGFVIACFYLSCEKLKEIRGIRQYRKKARICQRRYL